jgi:type IV secretion system protein VirD4
VRDEKYDILRHPNVALTVDGKGKPYKHGEDTRSIASISFDPMLLAEAVEYELDSAANYELLSDEEMEEYFNQLQITGGNAK